MTPFIPAIVRKNLIRHAAGLAFGVLLALLLAGCVTCPSSKGLVKAEFIFRNAPFKSCHASTIAETPRGLVAAWFGGTAERNPDVCIYVSRNNGGGWTKPLSVADGVGFATNRLPTWNPVLFQMPNGPLLLFYKVGPSPAKWWGMMSTSDDAGNTWSKPRRLPDEILGPIKNKPVLLADGSLLCPSSAEGSNGWRVHFERTADLGQTWSSTPPINDGKIIAAIQPSILFHPAGRLQAVGRTKQGRVFSTWSDDAGRSWQPPELTALPNPNSGTDAVTLKDGRQLLVYNHNSKPKGRSPLNVAVSSDGILWQSAFTLENEPQKEFSYPAVIQTADGLVHITYTWERRLVKHVVLDPARLQLQPLPQEK